MFVFRAIMSLSLSPRAGGIVHSCKRHNITCMRIAY